MNRCISQNQLEQTDVIEMFLFQLKIVINTGSSDFGFGFYKQLL